MRLHYKQTLFLVFIILTLCFISDSHAEISFSVSPIRIEMTGEPGGSYNDVIEVSNEGKEKVRIKVAMQDWYLSEEGTPIFQKAGAIPRSCIKWLKINPVDFLLQPGEKKSVRYSVAIPPEIVAGGYWGAFVFETVPQVEPGQKTRAVAIKGNIASIVYITAGKPKGSGELIDMSFVENKDGGKVALRLKNNGTVHFRIKGDVKINDAAGKTVQTIPLPDVPVLPGYTRTQPVSLKERLPAGTYTAVATVDVGAAAIMAGEVSFTVK